MDNFEDKNYNQNETEKQTEGLEDTTFTSGSGEGSCPEEGADLSHSLVTDSNPYASEGSSTEEGKTEPYAEENPYASKNPYATSYNPYTSSVTGAEEDEKPKKTGKILGIISMILGIASVTVCCCSLLGFFVALAALILGIIAQVRKSSGFGIAGIITAAFGIVFGLIGAIFWFVVGGIESFWQSIMDEINNFDSSFNSSDSSFDNNNNAIVSIINYLKIMLKR